MSTVVVTLAALGVIGGQLALVFYLVKKYASGTDGYKGALEKSALQTVRIHELESALQQHAAALDQKAAEVAREVAARKKTEEQRDKLLDKLSKTGDPGGVAAAIRDELRALSEMPGTAPR